MPEQGGQHIIRVLRSRWQRNHLLAALTLALSGSVLLGTLLKIFTGLAWWWIGPIFLLISAIVFWLRPFRRISDQDISGFLNRRYPEMEESSQLLLEKPESLNLLQRLQRQKIEQLIVQIKAPTDLLIPLKRSAITLITVMAICIIAAATQASFSKKNNDRNNAIISSLGIPPDIVPAGIKNFSLTIIPPAYTRQQQRTQEQFTLKIEEGSSVTWKILTTGKIDSLSLRFNNKEKFPLKRSAAGSNEWTLQRTIKDPGFYQVESTGHVSVLYTLEVIHDEPANIRILAPQQYTTIEPGSKPACNLRVHITDDYGIIDTRIIATKASGKGESVSFKEQQLNFPVRFSGQKDVETSTLLDLAALGLQGGDELYFYIKATDNHGQESRSDMYFISLPDTAELLSMSGMESGVDQFPEYFRSQRQIIMDTERLLKERSAIGKDTFNARSNELGAEQKLLRLRYGKFLGEENESGGGGEHSPDDGHDHGQEEQPAYGDVQSLIDQYAHKHDNAEDATYFEPEQKAQLKAILTEMWNSELKLRTYIPADALPYQYKALRLLKDLQQKSRAYVSKTSMKMPPLKPEKRLTGNLEKITPANEPAKKMEGDQQTEQLRNAVNTLEMLKQKKQPAIEEQAALFAAEKAISEKAIAQPTRFLPALSAIRTVAAAPATAKKQDIILVQHALQQLINSSVSLPQKNSTRTGSLADHYFKKLNQ